MTPPAIQKPTLAAELFGGDVGFRFGHVLRWLPAAILVGAALLLVARRSAGALDEPPTPGTALLVALAAVSLAALHRRSQRCCKSHASAMFDGLPIAPASVAWYLPTAAMVLIGLALSMPETSAAALVVLWLVIVGSELAWLRAQPPRMSERAVAEIAATLADVVEFAELESPESDARKISQSWKRFVDPVGHDVLDGYARAHFEVGSRQASIHLAFCPPFERMPILESHAIDDVELRLVHVTVLPYAARIDVRLSEPAEEEFGASIGIRAVCEAAAERAGAAAEIRL